MCQSTAKILFSFAVIMCLAGGETKCAEVELNNVDFAKLWKSIAEVNRVWLDPSPRRLSYTVTATPKNGDARDTESVNRVWLEGENARWEMDVRRPNNPKLLISYALVVSGDKEIYVKGPEKLLGKERPARNIHCLRQGISWQTAMHAVYRNGLPKNYRVTEKRRAGEKEVFVIDLDLGEKRSSVGLGLFHSFKGQVNCRIDKVRLHINVTDMTPLLEEYVDREYQIEYPDEFLAMGEHKVPLKIRHVGKHFKDNSDWVLEGHFKKVNGNWMLDKALNIQHGKVAIEFVVGKTSTKQIDPSIFTVAQR